jgi:hypothetical protein
MRDTTVLNWLDTTVGYWWFILGLGAVSALLTGVMLWMKGGRARELSLAAACLAFEAPMIHAGYDAFGLWGAFGGWAVGVLLGGYVVMLAALVACLWCQRAAVWVITVVGAQIVALDVLFGFWLHAVQGIGIVAAIWGYEMACQRFGPRVARWYDTHAATGLAVLWTLYPVLLPGYIRLAEPPFSGIDGRLAHALTEALVGAVPAAAVVVAATVAVRTNLPKARPADQDGLVASLVSLAFWIVLGSVAVKFGSGLEDFVGWGAFCALFFFVVAWLRGARLVAA